MMRAGGGLIMVLAWVNKLFIQQLFPLNVGSIAIKVNGCCKRAFDLCRSCCDGGGGDDGNGGEGEGDRLGSCLYFKCLIILSLLEKVR